MKGEIKGKWRPWIIAVLAVVQVSECWGAPPSISPQLLSTYRRFWFFNVTNQQKFLDGNEPLHLVEIGPYVFREVVEKNVTGTFENGTVEYYEKKTFFFVKEESVGDQSELMTTINAPILDIVARMVQHPKLSNFLNMTAMIVESYPEGKAFVTKTVEELLFKGFNLPFFDHLNTIFRELGWTPDEIEALWREVLPRDARDFRFAFYRDAVRNGTVDGPYLIGTGKEDPYDFGRIHLWHGESKHYMKPWSSEECNAINGTDGTLFPPLIHKETILQTFVTDLCRSMSFRYEKDVEFGVILGYRFVLHPDSVASVKVRPENECFCVGKCLGAGLLDVSKCFDGKPIVMSSPHFLIPDGAGDNGLNKSLMDGIAPMKDSHETFLDVEPVNGTLLRVKKRLQTNIKVRQVDGYKAFANLPEMEVPVFWTEESAELSQEESKEQRRRPKPPKPPSGYGSTDEETPTWAIGVGVGVVVLVIILRCICKKLN